LDVVSDDSTCSRRSKVIAFTMTFARNLAVVLAEEVLALGSSALDFPALALVVHAVPIDIGARQLADEFDL
jgi:hypothetical protein